MQTFLPYPGFAESAAVLDNKRLGKQRVEAKQILNALSGKSKGWVNHPATLMWYGYEAALRFYHDAMVEEWKRRGFKNNMPYLSTIKDPFGSGFVLRNRFLKAELYPHWWRDADMIHKLCMSHQSNLKRKDPNIYRCWSIIPDNLPYYWPVTKAEVETKRVLALCP